MKKSTKQILALLLAVCTLVSIAMPTVFATGAEGAGDEGTGTTGTEQPVLYEFYTAELGSVYKKFVEQAPAIKDAYDNGTGNWRFEAANDNWQFRSAGSNKFNKDVGALVYTTAASNGTTTRFFALRLKSPGEGKFDLTFNHGMSSTHGAKKGSVYIVDAAVIDAALGENAESYADALSADIYNSTEAFSACKTAVTEAIKNQTAVMTVDYSVTTPAQGSYTFAEGKEYVVVFTPDQAGTSSANLYLVSLLAEKSAEQPEEPAELIQWSADFVADTAAAGITYGSGNRYWSDGNVKTNLDNAYETNGWTYYKSSTGTTIWTTYPPRFYDTGLGMYPNATGSIKVAALKFVAPGTGDFLLGVTPHVISKAEERAEKAGAYILPMADYDKWTLPSYSTVDSRVQLDATQLAAEEKVEATVPAALIEGQEYILVFYVYDTDNANVHADYTGFSLRQVETEAPTEPTEPSESTEPSDPTEPSEPQGSGDEGIRYEFYTDDRANAKVRELSPAIAAAYKNGTGNWRYEAADSSWQFRLAGESDQKNGTNVFNPVYKSMQYVTAASNTANTRFIAVRIQSPGAGVYDLTLTHGASQSGAIKGSVYIVDAAVIDEALGENADTYADTIAQDIYQGTGEAYTAYKTAILGAIKDQDAAIVTNYYAENDTTGVTANGRYAFEADKAYVLVFTSDIAKRAGYGYIYLNSLSAVYSDDQSMDIEPPAPQGPGYTDGVYDFTQLLQIGNTLAQGQEDLAAMYEADTINWKYETKGGGLDLGKVAYHNETDSVRAISAKNWWLAFRIKAPAQDGAYSITMTHGATSEGAAAGSIFVIPGDTPTNQIFKIASRQGPTITTDWSYGEISGETFKGRETAAGTVNMKAGQEYIVVFLPTEKAHLSDNACFYMGKLQLTRTGEYVEDTAAEGGVDGIEYEFYDWDNAGNFLNHYKTEEQLGKKIVTAKIAQEYADGTRNWTYVGANGFANFSTGTPYMNINVGETHYYVVKIKAPGTGTYEITYNHYAMNDTSSGLRGGVFIMPYSDGLDYATIRDEINFKDPIITTSYYAEKTTQQQSKGMYTAFQEGKEYLICFSVEDDDVTKIRTLKAYPYSMVMKRVGDYAPEAGAGTEDGVVYDFAQKTYSGEKLEGDVAKDINNRYANGTLNWNFETVRGSAKFTSKYMQFGTGYNGGPMVIRFKSPGEGKYRVTLRLLQFPNADAANYSQIYIVDAPTQKKDYSYYNDRMARQPLAETTFNTYETRMQKLTVNGEYNFQADKEYALIIYMNDEEDNRRTNDSCWGYAERMILKRIGEYEGEDDNITQGGLVLQSPISKFNIAESYFVTWEMNGHDYIAIPIVGNTMLIYDLDEWRLVDEVRTNIYTPRGTVIDQDGNIWISGDRQYLYCYNPFTGEGFNTGKISNGSSMMAMCSGDDGYLYFSRSHPEGSIIYRFDPRTQEYVTYPTYSWCTTVGETMQKGDYIYFTANSTERNWLVKMDKLTGKIISTGDFSENVQGKMRYTIGMEFLDDNYLRLTTPLGVTIFDIHTMTMLTQEQHGLKGPLKGHTSDVLDGRVYFTCSIDGLCYYDQETQTFGVVGGEIAKNKTKLVGKGRNTVTIDDPMLPGKSIITYGGMTASGLSLYAFNLQSMKVVELIGLVSPDFGSPQEMRELVAGPEGSNELYFSSMYFAPVQVYNTETRELGREITTNGQNDSLYWYKDILYIGNYTECVLTQSIDGEANGLFTLKRHFKQARIHTIAGGDDKLFVGTVPDAYNHGGLIAWYDLNTGLTYVVTGPDPEDVYYAKFNKSLPTDDWYRATTGEAVDIQAMWDKDEDGDGVYQYFKGPIPLQTITKVTYSNGYLYGLSSVNGGSNSTALPDESAQIFVYDVENMRMVTTIDLRDYISGVPSRIGQIESLEVDPDVSNKLWGVVSETLFSLTFDPDTGKVDVKVELSYKRDSITVKGWATKNIIFQGDYLYALLGSVGGLVKVNRKDTSDYEQILYNFKSLSEIPSQFVIGNDGDIYYTTGSTKLYVFNLDVTEEELAAAKAVQDAIDLIPDEFTLADRSIIEEARKLYDALAPANQPYVNNAEKLSEAELALFRLRIDALDDITLDDEQEVRSLIEEYRQLELDVRMTIDYQKISEAHGKLSVLVAERMVDRINAIGTVTLDKMEYIRACRTEYLALSRYERRLVTNEAVLNEAEAALNVLLLQRNEAAAVDKKIEAIGFVFFGDEKAIIDAQAAYNKLDDAAKEWVEKHGTLVAAEIIIVVEYLLALAVVTGGVLYAIPATRAKIFKKKEKITEE